MLLKREGNARQWWVRAVVGKECGEERVLEGNQASINTWPSQRGLQSRQVCRWREYVPCDNVTALSASVERGGQCPVHRCFDWLCIDEYN